MKCDRCGRLLISIAARNVRCPCGHLIPAGRTEFPCLYRGDSIGLADCGCSGHVTVYQCAIYGICMERKLTPGKVRATINGKQQCCDMKYCAFCRYNMPVLLTVSHKQTSIITTHYNPVGFSRLRETYYEWRPTISGSVIAMEMVIDRDPEIAGSRVIHGSDENILWQKERMINLALESLPPSIKYVAWVDHDIVFENPYWISDSIDLIESGAKAVQPFHEVAYLDHRGKISRTARGAASVALAGGSPSTGPGAAWIADRQWLDSIGGLYDLNVVGGGDAVFFEMLTGHRTAFRDRQPAASRDHLGRWIAQHGPVKIGSVPGRVRHIYHGDFRNRQYVSRDEILRRHNFDPERHVKISPSGLLSWTDQASPEFRAEIRAYFENRDEDDKQASV